MSGRATRRRKYSQQHADVEHIVEPKAIPGRLEVNQLTIRKEETKAALNTGEGGWDHPKADREMESVTCRVGEGTGDRCASGMDGGPLLHPIIGVLDDRNQLVLLLLRYVESGNQPGQGRNPEIAQVVFDIAQRGQEINFEGLKILELDRGAAVFVPRNRRRIYFVARRATGQLPLVIVEG